MACLSKHGRELLRIESLTAKIAYMEDGNVLRNYCGGGWKLWKRVKAGVNPVDVAERRRLAISEDADKRPDYLAFKRLFHEQVPTDKRGIKEFKVAHYQLLSNDIDGLWSELNDMAHFDIGLDDLKPLVEAFDMWQVEAKELRDPTNVLG